MEEILKILVVDDDEVARMAVRQALQAAGLSLELLEVGSYSAAIALLQQQPFDCVLLDYQLPDGDGLTLVKTVREAGIQTALIVLTSQGDEQIAVELMKAGASDYLSKGKLAPESLSRSLRNAIRLCRAEIQAAAANQKLRESEARFRSLVQNSSDIITILETDGTLRYVSPSIERILGYQPETLMGQSPFSYTHPVEAADLKTTFAKILTQPGIAPPLELRVRHAAGHWVDLEVVVNNLLQDPGVRGVILNSRDITERKQLEQALRASEGRFRRLAEADMIGVITATLTGQITDANAAFLEMVGYTREDLLAGRLDWAQMTPPEYVAIDEWAIAQLQTVGVCSPWEKKYIRQDGSCVSVLIGAALLESGQETICFVLDITQAKQAEIEREQLLQQLETERGRLEAVLRQMPAGVIIAEAPSGKLVLGNEQVEQIWHHAFLPSTEIEQYREYCGFHADGRLYEPQDWPLARAINHGEVVADEEVRIWRGDQTWGVMRVSSSPIRDRDGNIVAGVVIFYDVTERQQAEARLRQQFEQLQAIYQITDAVSRAGAIEEIYEAALNGFQQALAADRASVLVADPDGVMRFKAWRQLSDTYRQATEGHSLWSLDAKNPQPIWISNVETELSEDPLRSVILQEGIRALGLIPLIAQGQLLGKFMLYYDTPHIFTEDEMQLAQTITNHVAFVKERKRREAKIMQLNRDLQRRVDELQTLFDVIPIGIGIADEPSCEQIRVNPYFAKLLAMPLDGKASLKGSIEARSTHFRILQDGKESPTPELPLRHAAATGAEVLETEIDVIHNNGHVIKLLEYAAPLFDEQGRVRGCVGAFLNITERKQAEESQRFLAEAGTLLAASLDYQTTLENLAQLMVPSLADWCVVDVVEADQTLRRVAIAHANPEKLQWAEELDRRYPPDPNAPRGTPNVVRTGQSEFYPEIDQAFLGAIAQDSEHLEMLKQIGFSSAMLVPLVARGRTLGVISIISAESGRHYTRSDLAFVEDLAHRAALAADNARLYREAQEVGENLRQAILILGEQQQQLRTLQRLTNLLNQRLADLPGLLQTMVRSVCGAIPGAEFGLIALRNTQRNLLELTAKVGVGMEKLHLDGSYIRNGFLGQVFLTGESLLLQGESLQEYGSEEMPASIYAVAIESAQAGRLGVLAIGNWQDPQAFDDEDQRLLVAFGEQAAIAINNARLINVLEEREERLAVQNDILARQNTELERQRQQIQLQNLQLLEAAQLKSQFLATMSHELRTPMNAIIGFSQLLLRQPQSSLNPQQRDMVGRVLNNGKNLLALINDILDLSKIEVGRLELKPEEINLEHLVKATTEELRSLAEQKNLDLSVSTNLVNPCIINDTMRLRQVLVNLLSNAIKFTDFGRVSVKAWEVSPSCVAIAVQDTGIGIAQSDLQHIFEEFRQVDQTTTRKHGGTGLGLAITDWLVQMMDGSITVESTLGQGSTFRVELPRHLDSPR
ncbi:MAG: PAS domain S-box protein [Trichocoleus desertorum ATA4-8-CV12]|jgi:PAS domain S-box-containing protein|nr:PAS domain S-box protein [Trichocoleus desertorum ATA4-8-CV12]